MRRRVLDSRHEDRHNVQQRSFLECGVRTWGNKDMHKLTIAHINHLVRSAILGKWALGCLVALYPEIA